MRQTILACLLVVASTVPAQASGPWVHTDWQYRVPFHANETRVAGTETHTDFAMLVLLDGARHAQVFANAKSDGSDLLFTNAEGATILEREIVSYDPIGETAEIWVRVPGLSKSQRSFYLYFGNPLASLEASPTGAWSERYRAVYHFEDDPADLLLTDSSPAEAHASLSASDGWTSGDVEPGKIGQGWHLNGTTHHIATNAISTADSSYTVEAWVTHDNLSVDFLFQALPDFWHVSSMVIGSQSVDFAVLGISVRWNPSPLPIQGPHHHYLWEFDAVVDETIRFYYDGVPQTILWVFPAGTPVIYTGRLINPDNAYPVGVVGPMYYVPSDFHSGGADEFRLREGSVSAERILTEFNNADDNPAFFSFGCTESIAAGATVHLQDDSVLWRQVYAACDRIVAGPNYSVLAPGHLSLVAGNGVEFQDMFEVGLDAGLTVDVGESPSCSVDDPGGASNLLLVGGNVNGSQVNPSNRKIVVGPGETISGAVDVEINSTWGSSDPMAMGITPTWGPHSGSYTELTAFSGPQDGLLRTIPIDYTAPATAGHYNLVIAYRAETTAAQVFSATNGSQGDPQWDNGDDIAGWSNLTLKRANRDGSVCAEALPHAYFFPATALEIEVPGGALYHLDEGEGVVAADSSGVGNQGAVFNADYVPGFSGTALRFSAGASMDRVDVPSAVFSLMPDDSFYIQATVRPNAYSPGTANECPTTIFRKRALFNDWTLQVDKDGSLACHIKTSEHGQFEFAGVNGGYVPLNTWSVVACGYDGQKLTIWVDGQEAGTTPLTGTIDWLSGYITTEIGNNTTDYQDSNCQDYGFRGDIDEVVVTGNPPL